jgi:hypothetical protein
MPTSYTTTVTVTGYTSGITYGTQLDSLEIVSGSTSPYELPQPPSARASFIGLPTVYTITQTPDWWIGKEVTFTIAPQGATGTVTWTGIVQGYSCTPVQTTSTDQIVELDLLGATSRLSTEIYSSELVGFNPWTAFGSSLNGNLQKLTWSETPAGLTWAMTTTTWAGYDNNITGLSFINRPLTGKASDFCDFPTGTAGSDILSLITNVWSTKLNGWFWFDGDSIYLNQPASGYLDYTQLTSLNAQSCVLWSSLSSSQNFGNIVNNGRITKASNGVEREYIDGTSYNSYGNRFQDFGYSYEYQLADIPTILQNKINAYKQPNTYLQSLTIDLDLLTHVTGEWQNFYNSTKPVRLPLTNIPAAYGGNHTYMVRGVQLNLTQKHAEATLLVVPSTIYNPS